MSIVVLIDDERLPETAPELSDAFDAIYYAIVNTGCTRWEPLWAPQEVPDSSRHDFDPLEPDPA
jgi:hypothetical protein